MLKRLFLKIWGSESSPRDERRSQSISAGSHAKQIGQVHGNVYIGIEPPVDKKELVETLKLYHECNEQEKASIRNWAEKKLGSAMFKTLRADKLGLALRYIRVVHKNRKA